MERLALRSWELGGCARLRRLDLSGNRVERRGAKYLRFGACPGDSAPPAVLHKLIRADAPDAALRRAGASPLQALVLR